jgi:hypothetical protein
MLSCYLKVNLLDLIIVSSSIAQCVPQAIGCKLYGLPSDESDKQKLESFKAILSNSRTFMATIYKDFLATNRIINSIPLQLENTRPIEVIIHIDTGSQVVDLYEALAKKEEASARNYIQVNSPVQQSTPIAINRKDCKIQQPIAKLINAAKQDLKSVRFHYIKTLNQFYLSFLDSDTHLAKLEQMLLNDYIDVVNNTFRVTPLNVADLKKNLICVRVTRINNKWGVSRVVVEDFSKSSNQSLQINLYMLDLGTVAITNSTSCLFPLLDTYRTFEPLSFECSLSDVVESEARSNGQKSNCNNELILEKFTHLAIANKILKIRGIYLFLLNKNYSGGKISLI